MRYYLLRATTCGVRNIVKMVTLDFYGRSNLKTIDPNGHNVRAVYGANGSGKSALVFSFLFAKSLMETPYFLKSKDLSFFENLINKKTESFIFNCDYAVYNEGKKNKVVGVFSYHIEVAKRNGRFQIVHERLAKYGGNSLNGEVTSIVDVVDGNMSMNSELKDDFAAFFYKKTLNILSDSSFISMFHDIMKEYTTSSSKKDFTPLMFDLAFANLFGMSIKVFLDNEDLHLSYYVNEDLINNYKSMSPEDVKTLFINQYLSSSTSTRDVKKDSFEQFQNYINRLTTFLQLFKPTLKRIEIDKKEDSDYYHCSCVLVYSDCSVNEEYESTGIKKLMRLFPFLDAADKGKIVFIDELDANISGVYLQKLIEFISQYGKGQLLFTAHNLDPMHYLFRFGKSIYFLGEDNVLVPWVKNANYRPYILFPEGMIKGSPFNIGIYDFLSAFGKDKE